MTSRRVSCLVCIWHDCGKLRSFCVDTAAKQSLDRDLLLTNTYLYAMISELGVSSSHEATARVDDTIRRPRHHFYQVHIITLAIGHAHLMGSRALEGKAQRGDNLNKAAKILVAATLQCRCY